MWPLSLARACRPICTQVRVHGWLCGPCHGPSLPPVLDTESEKERSRAWVYQAGQQTPHPVLLRGPAVVPWWRTSQVAN
jgi:hypothetical protein